MTHLYKSVWRMLLFVVLGLGFAGCTNQRSAPTTLTIPARATLPNNVSPDEIYQDPETAAMLDSLRTQATGGVSIGFKATYGELTTDVNYTFALDEGDVFKGEFHVFSGAEQARDFVIMCLLDYRQTPCNPTLNASNMLEMAPSQEYLFPVEIPNIVPGIHDFALLIVRDPYANFGKDIANSTDVALRAFEVMPFYGLYVGEAPQLPEINILTPSVTRPPSNRATGSRIIVNTLPNMTSPPPRAGIPAWLNEPVNAGDSLQFYLHFTDGGESFSEPYPKTVAVMAFIDYEEVPLKVEGVPHMPLYVERAPDSFQTLEVTIDVPEEIGQHEMLIVVQDYAYQRFTARPEHFYYADSGTSDMTILDVTAAD